MSVTLDSAVSTFQNLESTDFVTTEMAKAPTWKNSLARRFDTAPPTRQPLLVPTLSFPSLLDVLPFGSTSGMNRGIFANYRTDHFYLGV